MVGVRGDVNFDTNFIPQPSYQLAVVDGYIGWDGYQLRLRHLSYLDPHTKACSVADGGVGGRTCNKT